MEPPGQTEDELEAFRRQWKEEVQAKNRKTRNSNKNGQPLKQSPSISQGAHKPLAHPAPKSSRLPLAHCDEDGSERSHHDIDDKGLGRKVGDHSDTPADSHIKHASAVADEPKTALEYYEEAAEKEGQGRLGDSLADYRKAFKLDAKVHEKYKSKHFPAGKAAQQPNGVSTSTTDVVSGAIEKTTEFISTRDLIASFASCSIEGEAPPTEFSPPPLCPIANVPAEVLVDVLIAIAHNDLPSLVQISQASKHLAYLVSTEDAIWRRLIHDPNYGFHAMLYDFTCGIEWQNVIDIQGDLHSIMQTNTTASISASSSVLPLSSTFPTYRHMFRTRPRIRFNGCYISTVNYTRPGAVGSNSLTWNHNILIVTYYRYLRFFRDGSLISLLTTAEPADVVPYLQKEYVRYQSHGGGHLPQIVMKDALKGRWRLSGDPFGAKAAAARMQRHQGLDTEADASEDQGHQQEIEPETEGDVHIETEGVVSKYKYIMQLRFASATSKSGSSSATRSSNNKLNWVGYWCHNKLTDDVGEFGLKNDRPYFWSRVRSWH